MADVNISIAAQLKEFEKSLAKLPDIGAKEARGLVKKMSRELKAAERAAKKLAKATKSSGVDMGRALEGAKNAAEGLGGSVGGMAGSIEKAMQAASRLGGAAGPLGVALVGVSAGAALAVGGMFAAAGAADALIHRAESAVKELEPFHDALGIEEGAIASIGSAATAFDAVRVAVSAAEVAVAAELAPALEDLARSATKTTLALADDQSLLRRQIGGVADAYQTFLSFLPSYQIAMGATTVLTDIQTGALGYLARELDDTTAAHENQAAAIERTIAAQKKQAAQDAENAEELAEIRRMWAAHERVMAETERELAQESAKRRRLAAEADRERAGTIREIEQALKTAESAEASLGAMIAKSTEGTLTAQEKVRRAYEDRAKAIDAAAEAGAQALLVNDAIIASEAELARELLKVNQEATKAIEEDRDEELKKQEERDKERIAAAHLMRAMAAESIATITDLNISALQQRAEAEIAAADRVDRAWARQERHRIEALEDEGKISAEKARIMLEQIDKEEARRLRKNQRLKRDEEKAARRAWRVSQAAAASAIPLAVAQSAAALTPFYWFLGPGAPVAAAATAGIMGGIQGAAIASSPPPSFASGGSVAERATPNHVPIMASLDEGIVTGQGMASLGGSAGLEALNRGTLGGGGVTVILPDGAVVRSAAKAIQGPSGQRAISVHTGLSTGRAFVYGGR